MTGPRWLLATLLLAGCVTSEGPDCGVEAPMAGTWAVSGTKESPLPGASFDGTLTITSVHGCRFSGDLSLQYTPDGGATITLTGLVNGSAVDDSTVNFDADFPEHDPWTHVGVVRGDSLSGEWFEGAGPNAPRGGFHAERTAP